MTRPRREALQTARDGPVDGAGQPSIPMRSRTAVALGATRRTAHHHRIGAPSRCRATPASSSACALASVAVSKEVGERRVGHGGGDPAHQVDRARPPRPAGTVGGGGPRRHRHADGGVARRSSVVARGHVEHPSGGEQPDAPPPSSRPRPRRDLSDVARRDRGGGNQGPPRRSRSMSAHRGRRPARWSTAFAAAWTMSRPARATRWHRQPGRSAATREAAHQKSMPFLASTPVS